MRYMCVMLPWRAFYSIQLIFYRFLLPSFISGTGSNPRWDHQIWAITTGFGELCNGSGSFLYFSFVSQRRLDVCLAARHLYF
jgi:hypothetical protein